MKRRPQRGKKRGGSKTPPPARHGGRGKISAKEVRRQEARRAALDKLELTRKDQRRAIGIIGPTVYDSIVRLRGGQTARNIADALARRVKERELRRINRTAPKVIEKVGERFYKFDERRRAPGKKHFRKTIGTEDVAEYIGEKPTGKIYTGSKARGIIRRQRTEDLINGLEAVTGMTRKDARAVIKDARLREERLIRRFKKSKEYKMLDKRQRRRFTIEASRGRAMGALRDYVQDHGWYPSEGM